MELDFPKKDDTGIGLNNSKLTHWNHPRSEMNRPHKYIYIYIYMAQTRELQRDRDQSFAYVFPGGN